MQEWLQVDELNSRQEDWWYFPSCGELHCAGRTQQQDNSESCSHYVPFPCHKQKSIKFSVL